MKGARVYATSTVNNDRMHSSLKRFGFKPVGVPYPSKQNEPGFSCLYVRGCARPGWGRFLFLVRRHL